MCTEYESHSMCPQWAGGRCLPGARPCWGSIGAAVAASPRAFEAPGSSATAHAVRQCNAMQSDAVGMTMTFDKTPGMDAERRHRRRHRRRRIMHACHKPRHCMQADERVARSARVYSRAKECAGVLTGSSARAQIVRMTPAEMTYSTHGPAVSLPSLASCACSAKWTIKVGCGGRAGVAGVCSSLLISIANRFKVLSTEDQAGPNRFNPRVSQCACHKCVCE